MGFKVTYLVVGFDDGSCSYSWGPGQFNYQAFACYDLNNGGNQTLDEYGIWTADMYVSLCLFVVLWAHVHPQIWS